MNDRPFRPHSLAAALALSALFAACVPGLNDDDPEENAPIGTDDSTGDSEAVPVVPGPTDPNLVADTVNPNTDWFSHAVVYRGEESLRVEYACPDSGTAATVWGTNVYTDDSSVCTAGVHAGRISFAAGGRVVIEIRPGRESYDSLTRNGVTTRTYGSWGGSYIIL